MQKKSYLTVMIFCAFMVLYFQQFRQGGRGEGVNDHNVDKKQVNPIRITRLCSKWKCRTQKNNQYQDLFRHVLVAWNVLRSLWEGTNYKAQRRLHRRLQKVLYQQEVNQFTGTVSTWSAQFLKITFLKLSYPRGITAVGHSLPNQRSGSIFVSLCK